MTLVRLRRHAPEAQSADTCSLCGARRPGETQDHLLVGTPGTPAHDGAVCTGCGGVLDQVVRKFGCDLTVTVEEAQRRASDREVTLPGDY
jgi:hypothetical protein